VQRGKIRPLTDGERSRISKAKVELKGFQRRLEQAIASAETMKRNGSEVANGFGLYWRFLRENFGHRLSQLPSTI
jgi:hypothetical protein